MQAIAYQYERQIQLMEAQRRANIARAEQLRLARADASASVSAINRLRASLGNALIAAGERLRQDLAQAPAPALKDA